MYTSYCPWNKEAVLSCQTKLNCFFAPRRINPMLWACRSCMRPCLWAPWPRTGSCSSWLPSWVLTEPWGTPAGAWTPSRTSCSNSSDLTSPRRAEEKEKERRKQRDGSKQSSSSSSSSLFKLLRIWGRGGGVDDEDCRNWGRGMTESEEKMPRWSTKRCSTSSSSSSPFSIYVSSAGFRRSSFRGASSSSHYTLFFSSYSAEKRRCRGRRMRTEGGTEGWRFVPGVCDSEPQCSPPANDSDCGLVLMSTCDSFI